jgi:energy-coupling factor transporter ATP-binding protein EcfA2
MKAIVVLVTGPSGSGKTRLIEKLAAEAPASAAVLYICHRFVQEFGTTPPLAPALAARVGLGGYASVFDFGSGASQRSRAKLLYRSLHTNPQYFQTPFALYPPCVGYGAALSGCACCSPRGDFQRAIEEVLTSASSSHSTSTVVFVETTGLADPSVFLSVLAEPSLGAIINTHSKTSLYCLLPHFRGGITIVSIYIYKVSLLCVACALVPQREHSPAI